MHRTAGRTAHYLLIGNALFPENQDVLVREELFAAAPTSPEDRAVLLDAVFGDCLWIGVALFRRLNFRDTSDIHLIELAVAGNAAWIVTGNGKDFAVGN